MIKLKGLREMGKMNEKSLSLISDLFCCRRGVFFFF